jgi:hypothetical protein
VKARLNKAEAFIEYLAGEEELELAFFGDENFKFMPNILESFRNEREGVLRSATRQRQR